MLQLRLFAFRINTAEKTFGTAVMFNCDANNIAPLNKGTVLDIKAWNPFFFFFLHIPILSYRRKNRHSHAKNKG